MAAGNADIQESMTQEDQLIHRAEQMMEMSDQEFFSYLLPWCRETYKNLDSLSVRFDGAINFMTEPEKGEGFFKQKSIEAYARNFERAMKNKDLELGAEHTRNAMQIADPDNILVMQMMGCLAHSYFNFKEYDKSLEWCKKLLERDTYGALSFRLMAYIYGRTGDREKGMKLLKITKEMEEQYEKFEDMKEQKGYDAAGYPVEGELEIDTVKMAELSKEAGMFFVGKKYDQALDVYREMIGLDPESFEAQDGLSACYEKLGNKLLADYWQNRSHDTLNSGK
jgi:tetratricopeptide (TPR) repeat protein